MFRAVLISGFVGATLLLAGCSEKTTAARDVGLTSAQLTAQGSCDSSCAYRFRFAPTFETDWPDASIDGSPYTTPQRSGIGSTHGNVASLHEPVKELLPDTTYRYQVCGRDAGFSDLVCVGPDGRTGSVSTFTTPPGDYVYGKVHLRPDYGPGGPPLDSDWTFRATARPDDGGVAGSATQVLTSSDRQGHLQTYRFLYSVSCLRVEGTFAVVGLAPTNGAPLGPQVLFLQDLFTETEPGADRFLTTNVEEAPTTCPAVRSGYSEGVTSTVLTVHDAP